MSHKELFQFDVFCVNCKKKDFTTTLIEAQMPKNSCSMFDPDDSDMYIIRNFGNTFLISATIVCNNCGQEETILIGSTAKNKVGIGLYKTETQTEA